MTGWNNILERLTSLEDGLKSFFPPIITSWIHWPEATRMWKPLLRYLWTFITSVSCFPHRPRYPFICPQFIIGRGQMAHSLPLFHCCRSWDKRPVGRANSQPKARWWRGISGGSFVWLLPLLLSAKLQCSSLINRGQWRVSVCKCDLI